MCVPCPVVLLLPQSLHPTGLHDLTPNPTIEHTRRERRMCPIVKGTSGLLQKHAPEKGAQLSGSATLHLAGLLCRRCFNGITHAFAQLPIPRSASTTLTSTFAVASWCRSAECIFARRTSLGRGHAITQYRHCHQLPRWDLCLMSHCGLQPAALLVHLCLLAWQTPVPGMGGALCDPVCHASGARLATVV